MQSRLTTPIAALVFCYLLFFACLVLTFGNLPANVASHFDISGKPNGWTTREHCVEFSLVLGIALPALILAQMGGAGRIPVSFINLPHRNYWMSPERRHAALAILLRYAIWFSCLNVLFVTALHLLLVLANEPGTTPHLSGLGIAALAVVFLAGTGLWVASLLRHFSKNV